MLPLLYVITSNDGFVIEEELKKIKKEHQLASQSINTYDLLENTLSEVLEDANTYSFLDDKKGVVVFHANVFEAGENKIDEDYLTKLSKYLENPNPSSVVIFICEKLDERKKNVKLLKKQAKVLTGERNLPSLIKEQLSSFQLEEGVISLLIDRTNGQVGKIVNECQKLKLYINDFTISLNGAKEVVMRSINEDDNYIFSLTNAIVNHKTKEALQIYDDLLILNVEPLKILSLICSQFRLLYQVKMLMEEHNTKDQIASTLGIHPYRVEKAKEVLHQYSKETLLEYIHQLANLDTEMKTGKIDIKEGIDLFLLGLYQ